MILNKMRFCTNYSNNNNINKLLVYFNRNVFKENSIRNQYSKSYMNSGNSSTMSSYVLLVCFLNLIDV
jgi:hypothetical protein